MDQDLLGPMWENGNSMFISFKPFFYRLAWRLLQVLKARRERERVRMLIEIVDVGVFAQCGTGYDNVRVDDMTAHKCVSLLP